MTLKQWATEKQARYIDLINELGSARKTATACGVHHTAVDRSIQAVRRKAALAGYSPDEDAQGLAPHGFVVKGKSTYYDSEGQVRGQWVKTAADAETRAAALRAAFDVLAEDIPRQTPLAPPERSRPELCNVYTLTDSHVGMLAWHREGGDDWDLGIAERTLVGCFEQMVASSPDAGTAIVNQLGDFLHYDGLTPVTPAHGHILDADSRFQKMVETAVRILRRVINLALEKHSTVRVVLAEGNHDEASSVWLRVMFKALYENEPRISIDDSPLPYYVHQHGQTMLAFHHGHKLKNDALPMLFASQFPVVWGSTVKRYCHTGHRHHEETKEHSGMIVCQHPTLAARDAYAARGGWIAERKTIAYTYHTRHGQVGSVTVTPEMLS